VGDESDEDDDSESENEIDNNQIIVKDTGTVQSNSDHEIELLFDSLPLHSAPLFMQLEKAAFLE
jgi:hypothetical protein